MINLWCLANCYPSCSVLVRIAFSLIFSLLSPSRREVKLKLGHSYRKLARSITQCTRINSFLLYLHWMLLFCGSSFPSATTLYGLWDVEGSVSTTSGQIGIPQCLQLLFLFWFLLSSLSTFASLLSLSPFQSIPLKGNHFLWSGNEILLTPMYFRWTASGNQFRRLSLLEVGCLRK